MLRRILFYVLALAVLHASPGFHWHDHSHEAVQVSAAAAAHGEDAHSDHPDETGEESRCADCLLQALQAAPAGDAPAALSVVLGASVALAFGPSQERPQSPPAGRIRVRGPPAITA
jgi:hypothetical protein